MRTRSLNNCVLANILVGTIVITAAEPVPTVAQAQIEPVTDPDAYAIYALVIPEIWLGESPDILLQQETECIARPSRCVSDSIAKLIQWEGVVQAFTQENSRVRLLLRLLPGQISYRLIPRVYILADDARLAIKYPGIWQRRPESIHTQPYRPSDSTARRQRRSCMSGDETAEKCG